MNFSKSITELKSLTSNNVYKKEQIDWWLLKYREEYQAVNSLFEAIPKDISFSHFSLKYLEEYRFRGLYSVLLEVSECYKNETYFKEQLEQYDSIKNNVKELNKWLSLHYLDAGKQQEKFQLLFRNNRELKDYSFNLLIHSALDLSMIVVADEFKNTLRFLNILEKSKKIIISGVIKLIGDVEIISEKRKRVGDRIRIKMGFKRQKVVVATNDEHLNEHLILFIDGKIELLKDLCVGRKVKVYASLRGGKWRKKENKEPEYGHSLIGWDVELLE